MAEHDILAQVQQLVDVEHQLRAKRQSGEIDSDQERAALKSVEEALAGARGASSRDVAVVRGEDRRRRGDERVGGSEQDSVLGSGCLPGQYP